jgi:hypothetical protein
MSKTISAKTISQIQYNFTENDGQRSRQDSDSTRFSSEYTYGTGVMQVNSIIKTTGTIASGGSISIDFSSLAFSSFGLSGTADINYVKSILISNTSTDSGIDLAIRATGVNSATGFFNGGSGNLLIKPYSSYMYNDPYGGVNVATANNKLQLHNVSTTSGSTSGIASYSITVMGII